MVTESDIRYIDSFVHYIIWINNPSLFALILSFIDLVIDTRYSNLYNKFRII